ncbi:MAG: hypothetical protein ACI9WU_000245 [Myxococcota bacterium]|jgi:hypothetical protein
MQAPSRTGPRPAALIAGLAALGLAILVLILAARPLSTADLWFHLEMGEWYMAHGLWPQSDPMLHTSGELVPVQHEWLFGVLVYGIEQLAGHQGLRLAHGLSVLGIVWLAFGALRRQAGSLAEAFLGLAVFLVLSWLRLAQARPDLFSIAACLILYRLLLEPGRHPSRRDLVLSAALMLVWANMHSLFAIGLALIGVAMVGRAFHGGLAIEAGDEETAKARLATAKLLGIVLAITLVVTLLNPRGIWQHLTFFTSSAKTAVWAVGDEWKGFWPFAFGPPDNAVVLPFLTWVVADLLLFAFVVAASLGYRRVKAEAETSTATDAIAAFSPTLLLLGIVCIGAFIVSFRFLWLGIFPLLFALRIRRESGGDSPRVSGRLAPWVAAALTAGLLVAYPSGHGSWTVYMSDTSTNAGEYLSTPVNRARYADEGTRFLVESGIEGNAFNNYTLGAYLGHHAAPKVRTFIDGRAEHYPPEVMIDYDVISAAGVRKDGRIFMDILDDRDVEIFFGVGGPGYGYHASDTVHLLEGVPWWTLVFRSAGHGVWLKRGPRWKANMQRAAAWYTERGLPFDPAAGLSPGAVIKVDPTFAAAQRMVPADFASQLDTARTGSPDQRIQAWAWIGDQLMIVSDYPGAVQAYGQGLQLNPKVGYLIQRSVEGLLAMGRLEDARALIGTGQQRGLSQSDVQGLRQQAEATQGWMMQLQEWAKQRSR